MRHFSSIFLVSLIGIAQSRPVSDASPATSSTPQCTTIVLPIKAAANNTVFPPFPSDGNYGQYLGSFNASTLPKQEVTGTYDISATYCEPTVKVKGREDTVQLLLHAVGSTKVSQAKSPSHSTPTNLPSGILEWLPLPITQLPLPILVHLPRYLSGLHHSRHRPPRQRRLRPPRPGQRRPSSPPGRHHRINPHPAPHRHTASDHHAVS